MAGLWRKNGIGPKYLVTRRDGTTPDWSWFVLGARDKNAPAGLRGYADECERNGEDPQYVADVRAMADEWEQYRKDHGDGDPTAPPHRKDDPATIAKMNGTGGA